MLSANQTPDPTHLFCLCQGLASTQHKEKGKYRAMGRAEIFPATHIFTFHLSAELRAGVSSSSPPLSLADLLSELTTAQKSTHVLL